MAIDETLRSVLTEVALECGADRAAVIPCSEIVTDATFRGMCASNACGMYGRCWTCPPHVGEIDALMASLSEYEFVLVYQRIGTLEDSYDFEGMQKAKRAHYGVSQKLRRAFAHFAHLRTLHLGAGGCGVCDVCAARTGEPCRFPTQAMASLEAYGVNVSKMAASAGMRYINGVNTVTYFGAVFFSLTENGGDQNG